MEEEVYEDDIVVRFDWQITAMDVDCVGRNAVLAARRWLSIVDLQKLDDPGSRRKLSRESKWDCNCVQWNPHTSSPGALLAVSNQKVEVWDTTRSGPAGRQQLRAHTRSVSDVCWSWHDPRCLASCSMDAFVFLWDLRDPRKPAIAMKAVAGASQVKWNRFNEQVLASAHDGDVRIWDQRKPQSATHYISGHVSKINGLDWSPVHEHQLATCSQDGNVHFWNTEQPRVSRPTNTLSLGAPVRKAAFTPFGHGLVTTVKPQLRSGVGDHHNLQLWKLTDLTAPVHTMIGHLDEVLHFAWRNIDDKPTYQLASAARDQTLRLWRLDEHVKECRSSQQIGTAVSTQVMKPVHSKLALPIHSSSPHSARQEAAAVPAILSQPQTLQQEFSLLNPNIPNLTVEELNPMERHCLVSATGGSQFVQLTISFPSLYPNDACPSFRFLDTSTIDIQSKSFLTRMLTDTAKSHVRHNRPCLEPCLRQLVTHLNASSKAAHDASKEADRQQPVASSSGTSLDSQVPFPRTSGGRFCANGHLVVFRRPPSLSSLANGTPKTMAELAVYCNLTASRLSHRHPQQRLKPVQRGSGQASIKTFYQQQTSQSDSMVCNVDIYDVARLLNLNKQLAASYKIAGDLSEVCSHNAAAAQAFGRPDVSRMWQLVQLIADPELRPHKNPDHGVPWAGSPFGQQMVSSLVKHYSRLHDVQTMAIIMAVFARGSGIFVDNFETASSPHHGHQQFSPQGSPMVFAPTPSFPFSFPENTASSNRHMAAPAEGLNASAVPLAMPARVVHINPFLVEVKSEGAVDYKGGVSLDDYWVQQHLLKSSLIEPGMDELYNACLRKYGEILYRWGLLEKRAELLHYATRKPQERPYVATSSSCPRCHRAQNTQQCNDCKEYLIKCALCRLPVRGMSNYCQTCGHGGHAAHIENWFALNSSCPTGCGCNCMEHQSS